MTEREYRQVWDYERKIHRSIRRRRWSRLLWRLAIVGYFFISGAALVWAAWRWL